MPQIANHVPSPRFDLSLAAFLEWFRAAAPRDPQTRLQLALLLSIAVHALAVATVGIRPLSKLDANTSQLTVDLVNTRTESAPTKREILAQWKLDGGGNTDADRHAKSPLPVTRRSEPSTPAPVPVPRSEPAVSKPALTQSHEPALAVAPSERSESREASPEAPLPSAVEILSRAREELQLKASIDRELEAYNKRPRRKFLGARADEFRFARYIEDWRAKIERVGELNYPASARGTYGSMRVSVAIRADGSLEKVEIDRSSGRKTLDEAAVRIVQLAAPFAPFPPDISRDIDILSITRTWTFTRSDQFQAE